MAGLGSGNPSGELLELQRLIAPGNTQPGSFYRGSNATTVGQETMQRFGDWMQAPAAAPSAAQPHAVSESSRGAMPEWKLSDEMMNQKWGSVLRVLQPRSTNAGPGSYGGGAMLGHTGAAGGGANAKLEYTGTRDYHRTLENRQPTPRPLNNYQRTATPRFS